MKISSHFSQNHRKALFYGHFRKIFFPNFFPIYSQFIPNFIPIPKKDAPTGRRGGLKRIYLNYMCINTKGVTT